MENWKNWKNGNATVATDLCRRTAVKGDMENWKNGKWNHRSDESIPSNNRQGCMENWKNCKNGIETNSSDGAIPSNDRPW